MPWTRLFFPIFVALTGHQVHPSKLLSHSLGLGQFSASDTAALMYQEVIQRSCEAVVRAGEMMAPKGMGPWGIKNRMEMLKEHLAKLWYKTWQK